MMFFELFTLLTVASPTEDKSVKPEVLTAVAENYHISRKLKFVHKTEYVI
jgi:hypothetical protein